MPTLKLGNNSLLTLSTRITTPSIHIQKDGDHWYVPLFSGSKGAVVQSGDYNYTLGGLKVGSYRAAIGREAMGGEEEVVDIIYVFATNKTTWILTSNGDLYGCGYNGLGNQGSGDTANVLTFTKRASNVKTVSCSENTTWYIDNNNDLYGCGDNSVGQQGSGQNDSSAKVLTFTKRASNVKTVSCTSDATWYIDNNNDLYGCGANSYGQQGSGTSGNSTNVLVFTKRASNVKTVSCTYLTTWYIDNNNNLYGCGSGMHGHQGSGDTSKVLTFTKRASNVKEVSCGWDTTWYIDNNNNLYGCGYGWDGLQGSGNTSDVLVFTKRASNVKEVSCSRYTTWYIDNNNNLYGCGDGWYGQQGSGNTDSVYTFTKRAENVKTVSCSQNTTWYIDNNNNLYGCGYNEYGNQGSGASGRPSNVLAFTKRAENVKTVSCSEGTTWYMDNNNNFYGCGDNGYGRQGSGDTANVLTFTKIEL